ncbi:apses-domain-containing protein [Terfezia boudieri ATCC MYA-4762]|uniref:Apses-domain-containing protein n=1 Tax=Terfezia boudieri ATCC MYA-4762 TaxID=1051890 RepID=A0A3N4LIC7_9PEZI|nr:apses-domain-containing protein [Terfezia boudieri ATCC MYA-4762]
MRRRSDGWLNATQILKVADYDKPQRTRILEREVQRGLHEKVQGGYGKYQGTWVPLERGREIAKLYNVEEILAPIFDFRPSTESPPLAPKHVTAASSKPRPARANAARAAPAPRRNLKPTPPAPPSVDSVEEEEEEEEEDESMISDIEPLMSSPAPESSPAPDDDFSDFDDNIHHHPQQAYSDELLDYFMSSGGGDLPTFLLHPPPDFNVNEIIDDEAHTAFHWAAAMGDLQVLELLLHAGADITQVNARGETPLMRAVLFTNNYDRKSFPRLVELLRSTIPHTDKFRSSVFHHIAATTLSRNKCIAARYYADVLLQKMAEIYPMADIAVQLNGQDQEGDTALTIAARNGAKKLIRSLLAYNTNPHIPNTQGQTADELIVEVEKRKAYAHAHQLGYHHSSSSPYQPHIPLPAAPGTPKIGPISGPSNAPGANYPPAAQFPRPPLPPPPPQPHISEAAIRATQKAIPDIAEKLEALARAFDMELEEKEKDLRQARKLLEDTERERGGVGGMVRDLERACVVGVVGDKVGVEEGKGVEVVTGEIEKLRVEEEMLAKELRRQVEMRQEVELRWLVEEMEKERGVATDNVPPPSTEAESLEEKLATAKELARLQSERKELVGRIVGGAGPGMTAESRISAYRRLIAHCVGLEIHRVEEILPELLRTLEGPEEEEVGVATTEGVGPVAGGR